MKLSTNSHKIIVFPFHLLLSFFIFSCSTTDVTTEDHDNTRSISLVRFSYVLKPFWIQEEESIVLLEMFEPRMKMILLDKAKSNVCRAETMEPGEYETLSLTTIMFTRLSLSSECEEPSNYSIATYGDEIEHYEIITLKKVSNQKKIEDLDKRIKTSFVLQLLSRKAQDAIPGDISEIASSLPYVVRFPIPGLEVYIASYKFPDQDVGPRAIIVNNEIHPLTGWCSYPFLRAFKLNEGYYVESGSYCCGCGITIQELFRIKSTGPLLIHRDSSLSD